MMTPPKPVGGHAAPDKYSLNDLPRIDCHALVPLCQARCCTLVFALAAQDIEEGIVAWDEAHPYQNRQRPDGYCTHCQPDSRACAIHPHRPAVCRTYDCRGDRRIWLDFERRIPAP